MIYEEEPIFEETQQFREEIWIWAILLGITALLTYSCYLQLILDTSFGDQPASDFLLIGHWLIFGIGLPVAIYKARLVTRIYANRISIRFFPIHRSEHEYPFRHIERVEAVTYRPILQYGGWGIRVGWGGKAYNVSGKKGVKLHFLSGRPLLIGSQQSDALAAVINKAMGDEDS